MIVLDKVIYKSGGINIGDVFNIMYIKMFIFVNGDWFNVLNIVIVLMDGNFNNYL